MRHGFVLAVGGPQGLPSVAGPAVQQAALVAALEIGPPKSRAGKRSVPIPEVLIPIIRWHLACFAGLGEEGLVFTSPAGKPLRHSCFRRRVWLPELGVAELRVAELPAIHFHDLRHTGNTLAANAGASLRELMDRMGHDSERAARIYLHGSDERQHQIADSLSTPLLFVRCGAFLDGRDAGGC